MDNPNATEEDDAATPKHPAEDHSSATGKPTSSDIADPSTSTKISLTESTGDIFSAAPNTLLIHACNCQGTWNAGIASAFKSHYPAAYSVYQAHCKKWGHSLLFSALLIPPQTTSTTRSSEKDRNHFIGCLFTSAKKGKGKGSVESILEATGPAMEDLARKVAEDGKVEEVRMCKINSGLFRVPWERTKTVIEGLDLEQGQGKEIKVITLEGK